MRHNTLHSFALMMVLPMLISCTRKTRELAPSPPSTPLQAPAAAPAQEAPKSGPVTGPFRNPPPPSPHPFTTGPTPVAQPLPPPRAPESEPVVSTPLTEPDLTSASLQFLGQSYANYAVNQYLNLTIAHEYRLQIQPLLPQGISGPLEIRARVALALDTGKAIEATQASTLITWAEAEGKVSARTPELVSDLVLRYPQLSQAMLRNVFLIELQWKGSNLKPGRRTFWGKLAGLPEGGETRLVPAQLDLSALIDHAQTTRGSETCASSPHDLFLETHQLRNLDTAQVPAAAFTAFLNDASHGEEVLKALCKIVYSNEKDGRRRFWTMNTPGFPVGPGRKRSQSHLDYCLAKPALSFKATVHDFVDVNDGVLDPVPLLAGNPESLTYSVSAGWSLSKSTSDSITTSVGTSKGVTGSLSLGLSTGKLLPVDLGSQFSFSAGKTWQWVKARALSTTAGSAVSGSSNLSLVFEKAQFRIRAHTLRCLTVEPAQNQTFMPMHVCEAQPQARAFTETYYLVRQPTFTAALYDSRTEGTSIRMLIRGEQRFSQFMALISNPSLELTAAPAGEIFNGEDLLNPELPSLTDNSLPGVHLVF